jgi:hypothetical protein
MTDKCGWVSLKQHKKYFEIFEESLRGFKDKWFVVRPITFVGWKTIIVRGPKLDDEGRVEHKDDGEPIEVDCERFPFCWSMKHYAREAKSFTFRKGALSKEELADLKALEEFVEEFPPSLWEDREGNPVCDEEGYQLSSKKFINTKALLKCSTRAEAEDLLRMCLIICTFARILLPRMFSFSHVSLLTFVSSHVSGEMKNTQLTLRKLQAEKKRREAGGTSSSALNASAQSSPSKSIDLTGEKGVPEAAPVDKRPQKVARIEAGGSSMVGGHMKKNDFCF